MIVPFKGTFTLTQEFGENPAMYAQFGMKGHNGLDYGLPTKTQVTAPHDGKVIETASDPTGYGNYIKIENAKEGSVMAHLASFQVKVGDNVSEGQPIGLSDNTGNSTGPHLHWGYYLFPRNRQNGYAGFINQLPLIATPQTDTLDSLRKQRDENWNKYQAEVKKNQELNAKFLQLMNQLDKRDKQIQDIFNIIG